MITVDKINSLATPKKVSSAITAILAVALTGVFQFISLGCDPSHLLEASFYLTLGYRCILVFLAFSCALDFFFDRSYAHPAIQEAYQKFKELTKLRDVNFDDFLDEYNLKSKKLAWRDRVNHMIAKVELKIAKSPSLRKREKLKKEIEGLKYYLTDEYVNEHIDGLKVKFYRVMPSDFVAGEFDGTAFDRNKTRTDYGGQKVKSVMKQIVPFILISMVFGVTVTNAFQKPVLEVIINLLWDLSLIVIRFGQGVFKSQALVNASYLIPYNNRIDILKEYVVWNSDNEESKANKVVKFIENQLESEAKK